MLNFSEMLWFSFEFLKEKKISDWPAGQAQLLASQLASDRQQAQQDPTSPAPWSTIDRPPRSERPPGRTEFFTYRTCFRKISRFVAFAKSFRLQTPPINTQRPRTTSPLKIPNFPPPGCPIFGLQLKTSILNLVFIFYLSQLELCSYADSSFARVVDLVEIFPSR